jgi:hypothetical protein
MIASIYPLLEHHKYFEHKEWKQGILVLMSFCDSIKNWKLCSLLGAGSHGVVFEGTCRKTKKHAAMKYIPYSPLAWFNARHEAIMTREMAEMGIAFSIYDAINLECTSTPAPPKVVYGCDASLRQTLLNCVSVLLLEKVDTTMGYVDESDSLFQSFANFINSAQNACAAHNDSKLNNIGVIYGDLPQIKYIDCGRAITLSYLQSRGLSLPVALNLLKIAKRADVIALDASICRHYCQKGQRQLMLKLHQLLVPYHNLVRVHDTVSSALISKLEHEHGVLVKQVRPGLLK